MAHIYSDPRREASPTALPDVEVFYATAGTIETEAGLNDGTGWYWWACLPGCLPDGDPIGPFDTDAEAIADARAQAAEVEPLPTYEVVVGNIGTVYSGADQAEATRTFDEYVRQSQTGRGRAGAEAVTRFCDGEIEAEYVPPAGPATEVDDDE